MRSILRSLGSLNSVSITAATTLLVVAVWSFGVPILDRIELQTYDLRFLSRGTREPTGAVVLAVIDEKSLDSEGRWPWPRSKMAKLVDALSAAGAAVIAFDIGFLEPGLPENDAAFAAAIGRSEASVVLGYFFHEKTDDSGFKIAPEEIERQLALIDASKYGAVIARDPDADIEFERGYAAEGNISELVEVSDASGFFTLRQDDDGIVRWLPLVIQNGEELFPPLALQAVWVAVGKPERAVHLGLYAVEGVEMGPGFIPTNESGHLLINFLGPPKTFPHVSISDIFADAVPADTFEGKIVVVGATATGTYDLRSTPFSTVFPGLEIHANVIDNLLTGDFVTKPEWTQVYDLAAIVVLSLLVAVAVARLSAIYGLLIAVALFAGHILVARQLFVHNGVWLSIVYPLAGLGVTYAALTINGYVTEQRERQKIKGAFDHYVSPVVVEQMLKDPSKLQLGGDEKVLTVLFSDLQGFTSFSEKSTPQEMIQLLSEYYARMTEHVFERGGMLKEYVGDELMAIFGAPVEQADHATRACHAALEMLAHRRKMSEEWIALGRPPLIARTGVNSGLMLVGNLGSEYRLSYGVLGDQVNLGSRLEGLNKAYKTQILIGENTVELIGDAFALREVDLVRVVGKELPTRVHELLGTSEEELADPLVRACRSYGNGLEAYRAQRFDDAHALFVEALAARPDDGPSLTMSERCEVYLESPPSPEWDGVFEATKK
jgi:adenylate cyclase